MHLFRIDAKRLEISSYINVKNFSNVCDLSFICFYILASTALFASSKF